MNTRKILIASAIGTAILYPLIDTPRHTGSIAVASQTECRPGDIVIKSVRARWVDNCRTMSCAYLQGAGELINNCRAAVGIQLRMTGYDKSGAPIASHAAWPASVKNIPPGRYVFSLDHWLEHDPAIKRFDVTVESVRSWQD